MIKFKLKKSEKENKPKYLGRTFLGNEGRHPNDKYKILDYNPQTKKYFRSDVNSNITETSFSYSESDIDLSVKAGTWIFLD